LHSDIGFANWTIKKVTMRLQCSFLSLIHAGCTKVVKWLTLLHTWLQRISKRFSWEFIKTITLHLTFPVFNVSQLFFKLGYLAGERRLFLQTGKRNSGGLHQFCINLGNCGNKLIVIGKAVRGLRKIKGGFSTSDCGGNFGVHEVNPNVVLRSSWNQGGD